jgi:hypothetical protein
MTLMFVISISSSFNRAIQGRHRDSTHDASAT